jgi:8-oxo-dGTP diphosphatase
MIIENKHGHKLNEYTKISTLTELTDFPNIGAGLAVLLHQGKLVVCWNKFRNNWELPGGGREKGEDITSCVLREIYEETNQVIDHIDIVGVCKVYIPRMQKEGLWAVFTGELQSLSNFIENDEMAKMILWDFKSDIGEMDEVDMKIVDLVLNT